MTERELREQMTVLHSQFAEAKPTDWDTQHEYGCIVAFVLQHHCEVLGSTLSRQLLADYMSLPLRRPSALHSAILTAAVRMAYFFSDFHFAAFLRLWQLRNLRDEDIIRLPERALDDRTLAEQVTHAYLLSLMLYPDEAIPTGEQYAVFTISQRYYRPMQPMVVTQVVAGRYAVLVGAGGDEVECSLQMLTVHPLKTSDLSHAATVRSVRVGQVYDVLLHLPYGPNTKRPMVVVAYLRDVPIAQVFPVCVGYVEHIDVSHGHIHIYDGASRHFVATQPCCEGVREQQCVRFVPIVPASRAFKTAIVLGEAEAQMFPVRDIRIVEANREKGFAHWVLTDSAGPLTELLSSYQMAHGAKQEAFFGGYVAMQVAEQIFPNLRVGSVFRAIVFLRRGADRVKRPFVAKVL